MQTLQFIFRSRAFRVFLCAVSIPAVNAAELIDLTEAVIVMPDNGTVVRTAHRMLTEEVAKRTGITLASAVTANDRTKSTIMLCRMDTTPKRLRKFVEGMNVPDKPEGFSIAVNNEGPNPIVVLAGRDERGVLFATGRLLLQLRMKSNQLELPSDYRIATAPRYPHRGHQIGFRSLSHCYDAWTAETYEQYMRELAVFGANAFETNSFSDRDDRDGPHAKLTKGEMSDAWSQICADYGLNFWLFSHAIGGDGKSIEEQQAAIESRLKSIRNIPHIDHIYVTGGDGGSRHRRPDLMFEWTGRFAKEARKICQAPFACRVIPAGVSDRSIPAFVGLGLMAAFWAADTIRCSAFANRRSTASRSDRTTILFGRWASRCCRWMTYQRN